MKRIDTLLDSITMYRLILYYLILLVGVGFIFSLFGILKFNPVAYAASVGFLLLVSWATNLIFSKVFEAPTNVESVYISALILALILSPIATTSDVFLFFWAAVLTMASKYILALHKKHLFNPAAIAVVLTAIAFNGAASWWVGTAALLPFSLLGFLIVRKIRRYDLVLSFFAASAVTIFIFVFFQHSNLLTTVKQVLLSSPIFFFAFVMLTEPLTTPPTKKLQAIYGAIAGVLFAPQFHIGSFYASPEMALVIANIFSYLTGPKQKIMTTIQEKIQTAPDMLDFILKPSDQPLKFEPGQYMEWTLPHANPDSRGNRRYFTIASSPTEHELRLGIKFFEHGSSYKRALVAIDANTPIVGAQLSGDFTLPKDPNQKLTFIAGGIGVTPFRSMLKYLVDTKQARPIILLYANKTVDEIAYTDVFTQAQTELGIKTVYTLTDKERVPSDWQGYVGRIDSAIIQTEVPDFLERIFYLSGPHVMVTAYRDVLLAMGVPSTQIKTDFFPGL